MTEMVETGAIEETAWVELALPSSPDGQDFHDIMVERLQAK